MKPTRERGRPARTIDRHSLALSATWIERQRRRGIDIFSEHRCTGFTGFAGREVSAPEAGSGDDPVRACRCPGLQAGRFLKKSCTSRQPEFESSGEAAAALRLAGEAGGSLGPPRSAKKATSPWERQRKPMEQARIGVEPRRRRQHLPSGASPKAATEASEGRGCGRDARAPGGHDPPR